MPTSANAQSGEATRQAVALVIVATLPMATGTEGGQHYTELYLADCVAGVAESSSIE